MFNIKMLLAATLGAPLVFFIEKYFFQDWDFLIFLLVLICCDTILGLVKSWRSQTIASSQFAKLFTKLGTYFMLLIVVHVLCHFTVAGEESHLFTWLSSICYSGILLREGISIIENLAEVNPGLIPNGIISKLQKFQKETLDSDSDNFPPSSPTPTV